MQMTKAQEDFIDWVLGVLLYSLILTLFNDYSDILIIKSASTIFFAAVVLQGLTFYTFKFEHWVASKFNYPPEQKFKPALLFTVWAILFGSKFVFLAVIDFIFGKNVEISGFIGLVVIILAMVISRELIRNIYDRLGNNAS